MVFIRTVFFYSAVVAAVVWFLWPQSIVELTMNQDISKQYAQIVAKCWADPAFKSKLLVNTNATLTAEGVNIPSGVEVRVVENSAQVVYVVLPAPPAEGEIAEEDMSNVVGANTNCRVSYSGYAF